jgi:hypothetical protein
MQEGNGFTDRAAGDDRMPPPNPALAEHIVQVERKTFYFSLKENPRGRFLRITEDVGGRRDSIVIPAPGLKEFRAALEEMISASGR